MAGRAVREVLAVMGEMALRERSTAAEHILALLDRRGRAAVPDRPAGMASPAR